MGVRYNWGMEINLKLTILLLLPAAFMLLLVACGGGSQPPPDIGATVEAKLSALSIEATIDARVEDKLAATQIPDALQAGSQGLESLQLHH